MFDQARVLNFLQDLGKNNNRVWFDEHRSEYQAVRQEWIQFTQYLLGEMGEVYQEFFENDPRKCIYRINRDTRFSKDKTPYKKNFGSYLVPGGKKSGNAGWYVHAEPGNCFLAAGVYAPESQNLRKIREYIAENHQELETLLNEKNITDNFVEGFREENMKLIRPPRGFDKEHPAIERLKLKHFIIIHNMSDKEFLNKNFAQKVVQQFQRLTPIVNYLNRAIAD